ncbi:MAG TPA: redoxin domain-containing protein [Bacteroidia bacterium]|nr:redoxin domain-containing protein [Bacteroidia bacterium]
MKIKILFLTLLFFVAVAFTLQAAPKKHVIKFTIKGLKNTVCYLGGHYGDHDFIYDTAKVDANGNFQFSGDKELDGGVYFIISADKKKLFEFIIDKEQKFSMQADTTDYLKTMKVLGSEENSLFYQFQKYAMEAHEKLDSLAKLVKNGPDKEGARRELDTLNARGKKYRNDFVAKHADMFMAKVLNAVEEPVVPPAPILPNGRPDSTFAFKYYKAHFFDNIDFNDPRLIHTPVLFPKIKEYLTRLTIPDPDSVINAADYLIQKAGNDKDMFKFLVQYIIYTYENSEIMGMDAVFVHMAKKYYTPELATWVSASQLERVKERADQLEPILIGKKAIPIVLPDSNNIMQALDSVKAEYTVLYFWDYDCSHCQKETPVLIKWYDSIKAEGIEVYAVQTNSIGVDKWKDYIKKHKLDWINVMDIYHTGNFRHDYDVVTTPMIYLLDENKIIIAKKINTEDLDKVLKHYKERKRAKEKQ